MVDSFAPSGSSVQSELRNCALCSSLARYKCPRCATPTCSLSCSRKHKQDAGCSGERDKVQYVPMNAYGWGVMMRDYCYLEDVGRKVSDWGSEIIRGGYMDNIHSRKAANACKSLSRRGQRSKRDVLKDHLEVLGIDVEFLPAGMERRNINQSTYDQKSKCPLLTVELVFYPPATLTSISSSPPPPFKILSHRERLSTTLLTVLRRQVSSILSKQKENTPDWLPPIVMPHPEAPECFIPPHCYMRANTEFPQSPNTPYYHKLESTLGLSELFQRTSFIEFPTIYVFDSEASSFHGTVIDKSGSIVRGLEVDQAGHTRAVKRRKLNKTMGLNAVFSLLDGYGSEGSSALEEEMVNKHQTALTTLEAYSGSDNEVTLQNTDVEQDHSLNSEDNVPAEGGQLHLEPARLLKLVKQAHRAADEAILDWGHELSTDAVG